MTNVAIVGAAQTPYRRRRDDASLAELVHEVTVAALADAGLEMGDIDNIVTVSNDFWDGRTISSMAVMDASGSSYAGGKNVSTVEGDGTFGLFYGAMRILSGVYRTTLVVAHSKGSEGDPMMITNSMFDYIYTRPLGLEFISSCALQARRYMDKYGLTEADFALVSVKNRRNALRNPYAQLAGELTVEEVLASPVLADPLKRHDLSPISDGAAAVILADSPVALRLGRKPVWLKGGAFCSEDHFLGDRDLAEAPALREASRRAFEMAGVTDPFREIDVVELYDACSYMELLWLEEMGFCPRGEGGTLIRSGETAPEGSLPVNPSGGVLSAHAVLVAGLARVIEVVLQLRGEAGPRQLGPKPVELGLAHGINGPCGQSHCVLVLGA
ncbi:MAG TPA: thiolase family protein [Bacillota bacterium]|jgi:acetyl-CoA C-acetyltransferase|nr:thiolase family protein [Bacillota bacterium]HOB87316.1 thiolase family protein [Bacillota bacterium]HOP68512.1 thiolase family protein [Bacillota bacterium]HPT33259.1 thiolase family protein [Bacillota bacterium]HPZ65198.1 thiolase family protein [Bacillota bacterium]